MFTAVVDRVERAEHLETYNEAKVWMIRLGPVEEGRSVQFLVWRSSFIARLDAEPQAGDHVDFNDNYLPIGFNLEHACEPQ